MQRSAEQRSAAPGKGSGMGETVTASPNSRPQNMQKAGGNIQHSQNLERIKPSLKHSPLHSHFYCSAMFPMLSPWRQAGSRVLSFHWALDWSQFSHGSPAGFALGSESC